MGREPQNDLKMGTGSPKINPKWAQGAENKHTEPKANPKWAETPPKLPPKMYARNPKIASKWDPQKKRRESQH